MNTPLILVDVDETLIDANYNLTCSASEWKKSVRLAETRGVAIGLNSDSAYEMLQRRARAYGMNGPIVAERGALVGKNPEARALCTNADARDFQKLRRAFAQTLMTGARLSKYLTIIGHVNEISGWKTAPSRNSCFNDTAVLVNGFRYCSLSFYVRKRRGGHWIKDAEALDEVIGIVDSLARKRFSVLWNTKDTDRNPDFGICIFHHQDTKKSLACDPIIELFGERDIYMIGDSMSDYMDDNRIRHCAVANASKEFKERCASVANQSRTRGVIELIGQIVRS